MGEESPQQVTPEIESDRAEKLRSAQALDARPEDPAPPNPAAGLNALRPPDNSQGPDSSSGSGGQSSGQPFQAGGGEIPEEPEKPEPPPDAGDGDSNGPDSGSQDPVAIQREKLRSDTAKAAMAKLAGENSPADMDIDGVISKQTSRLNHWMLNTEMNGLFWSDVDTCGLSIIVTLPTRLIFCGVLAVELKHALTGSKSMVPYFPTLTWESFYPPGAEISNPLSLFFLYVAVLAYLITVVGITLVALTIIAIIYGAMAGGVVAGLEFLTDLFAS